MRHDGSHLFNYSASYVKMHSGYDPHNDFSFVAKYILAVHEQSKVIVNNVFIT